MKKFACILLALLCFGLCACGNAPAASSQPETTASSSEEASSAPVSSDQTEYIPLQTEPLYIRVGSYDDKSFSALFPMENADKMAISAVHHLPVLHFESAAEFTARVEGLKQSFQLDASYDGAGSFTEQTAIFDEAFFEENDLLMVYVYASSGSIRHEVAEASVYGGECVILVDEIAPEVGTDDIAEWFILLPVPRKQLEGCTGFDAVLGNGDW